MAKGQPPSTSPGAAAEEITPTLETAAAAVPDAALGPAQDPHPTAGLEPDLTLASAAAVPTPLVRHFPDQDRGTGLVLYGTAAGALRVHWRLEPNDLERAGGSFPPGGTRPLPVVRLRRERPGGGAEPVDQAALLGVARAGAGEAAFQVAADHGRYHAELGLTDGERGWLMLARSNALDNVAPVGVDWVHGEPVALPAPGQPPAAAPSPVSVDAAEPALQLVAPGVLVEVFPLVEIAGAAVRSSRVAALPPWASGPAQARWHGPTPVAPAGSILTQGALEGRPVRLPRPGVPVAPPLPAAAPAPPATSAAVRMEPLATLTYGQSPRAVAGLQVEAQLRITGQAAPGSLIDLFGHPFRIGPGGRFQLVITVTDPSLLRQALDLHPPPELTLVRDEP